MEHNLFLDIETIPTQSPEAFQEALANVKAPGTYKRPESIAKWIADNGEQVAREAIASTSFDPAQGHICTIAWAVGGTGIKHAHAESVEEEIEVLGEFFFDLDKFARYTFVGHYISGFDLRFILCRAVILGVPIPPCIPRDPKPWGGTVFDTMTAWAGAKGTISMDNLAKALGLKGKDGFDGSMVAEAWASGEHDKIVEYCKSDVETTREIYRKFEAVNW